MFVIIHDFTTAEQYHDQMHEELRFLCVHVMIAPLIKDGRDPHEVVEATFEPLSPELLLSSIDGMLLSYSTRSS